MNLNLSWDLFIFVFFGVVTAYSFIIGRNQTLKVISASYIGIICADALGNLFAKYLASSEAFLKLLKLFSIGSSEQATAFFKVFVLITIIVLIAVRGTYDFKTEDSRPVTMRLTVNLVLGILSAGLMMGAMLIFVSGSSMVTGIVTPDNPLSAIYGDSRMVRLMTDYANVWFFIPGLALILMSLFSRKNAE